MDQKRALTRAAVSPSWTRRLWTITVVFGVFTSLVVTAAPAQAVAGIPYRINFQGRLADSTGSALPDGLYNIKFRLFDAASSGTNLWEEDRVITGTDDRVQVTNGLFNVQFGALTALPANVFATSSQRYLEVELPSTTTNTCATNGCAAFTEGPFTPRQPLASSPYAYNADNLDGLDSTQFARTDAANTLTGTQLFKTTAFDIQNSAGSITALSADTANGRIGINKTSPSYTLDVAGDINTTGVLRVAGVAGSSTTCTGGNVLQNPVVSGGIITAGTCVAPGGNSTLQEAYDNSGTPASIGLTTGKDFVISAPDVATDPSVLINLQCTTCSASGGRFAVQDSGSDVLGVNPTGSVAIAPTAGQNLTITQAGTSGTRITASSAPTVDQLTIDNTTTTGVATAGVNGLSVNYKGGAAAVESAGVRIDYAPGTTSGGTWSGLRIVAGATGAVAGVTQYGFKLEGPATPGAGQETGTYIGTGWDIGMDVQSGGLQLAAQSDPTTPAANNLRIYAKDIAGRIMPKWVGPAGVDTPFQANLGFNRIAWVTPSGGSTLTTFITAMGSAFTNTGTANNPTPTSTNLFTSTRRATFSTGAIAGTVASHRQSTLQVWRGNTAGIGGFFYTIRFGTSALQTGNRAFVGLADSVAAPTNVDPTTATAPGRVGLAINASTGNWNMITNITGSAPTVTPLGASFPVNTTSLYELVLYSPPNGSSISYRVNNISTNVQTSGSFSSNIPANTTFLAPQFWITNNATAAAAVLDFGGWYLESDN